jgi:hypothetical protein
MRIVSQEIQDDMALASKILSEEDVSIIVIKNGEILESKKGKGIKPIIELIDEMGERLNGMVLGDRILGRASAFLCRYARVSGVYSPQATKTAIAILILGAIPCRVDELVPFIRNRDGDGLCPFEDILKDVDDPDTAYKILKEKIG